MQPKTLFVWDIDNTLINKQLLDNEAYKLASRELLGLEIEMIKHPVTGKDDSDFARHSNLEIWTYKLEQIQNHTNEIGNLKTIHDKAQVLTGYMGPRITKQLTLQPELMDSIENLITTDTIKELKDNNTIMTVSTTGSRSMQEKIMRHMGYFDSGIDSRFATYAEDEGAKYELLAKSFNMAKANTPSLNHMIYVTDSDKEIQEIKEQIPDTYTIGVPTGQADILQLAKSKPNLIVEDVNKDIHKIQDLKEKVKTYEKEI